MIVTDGFTGNVFAEGHGRAPRTRCCARCARRRLSSPRAKAGGLLLRPALGGLRDAIDPEAQGGAFLLGLRRLGVVPHGSFGARGIARAIELAARGVRADVVGRTHERLAAAGALRERARERGAGRALRRRRTVRGGRYGARSMTRDEVLSYIRAHLADELELDPARVEEGTRFKEDLEADSLDLYSLVQELEDTYGVKMSDEQAARIKTVGQAVDFVLAAWSTASRGPDPCARCTTCWRGCRTISPGRRSRMPRGPSGAPRPTSAWRCSATPCSGCR